MSLQKEQWNYAATIGFLVIVGVNIVLGWAFLRGAIDVKDWATYSGPFNGAVLGWVSRSMGQAPATP